MEAPILVKKSERVTEAHTRYLIHHVSAAESVTFLQTNLRAKSITAETESKLKLMYKNPFTPADSSESEASTDR